MQFQEQPTSPKTSKDKKEKKKKKQQQQPKEHKDQEKKTKKEKNKDKKKDKKKVLLPEYSVGSRCRILRHATASLVGQRCTSLGDSVLACSNCHKPATTQCPCAGVEHILLVVVKLETGDSKTGELDTTRGIGAPPWLPQRHIAAKLPAKSQSITARIPMHNLAVESPILVEEDNNRSRRERKGAAAFWCAAVLGAAKGSSLYASRDCRRVPRISPKTTRTEESDGKEKYSAGDDDDENALPELQSEVGALLGRLGMSPRFEQAMEKLSLRSFTEVRAMTPTRYISVIKGTGMSRPEALRLREALAPPDLKDRAAYPLFGAF